MTNSTVGVLGLGYVGLPLAIAASEFGNHVFGYDIDESKIENLQSGISKIDSTYDERLLRVLNSGSFSLTKSIRDFINCDVVVIAVPTPLDKNGHMDLSMLREAAKSLSGNLKFGTLVINESTSYPGTLRNLIREEVYGRSARELNLKFASAPERIDPKNKSWTLYNTPRIIGGLDSDSSERAIKFYQQFCNEVIAVESPEVAEAAKLLENAFRLVNISFVNEFAALCREIGLSIHDVIDAAQTKPFGFMPFRPSLGVGGHCIAIDPVYLLEFAREINVDMKILNDSLLKRNNVEFVLAEIKKRLGPKLDDLTVQVAGLSYKQDVADTRESPSTHLIKILRENGLNVIWHDDLVGNWEGENSQAITNKIDLGIIVTLHSDMNLEPWQEIRERIINASIADLDVFPSIF